ncbi:hypothetical protein [Conyzicola sp.]|uniref:hypothetical protein n=1 Tax=Conyzicola sp. TaxID=1969404 RepID=UPI00398A0233
MLEVVAIALIIVGTALGFTAARQITRANEGVPIPWSGRIPNQPPNAPLLRGLGGALVVVGSLILYSVLNVLIIAVVLASTASPLLVFVAHNRRVRARA